MAGGYSKAVILGDTLLGPELFGIQRFTFEILREIDFLDSAFDIEVLVPNLEDCPLSFDKLKVVQYGKQGLDGFHWRQLYFPQYVRQEKALSVDLTLGLTAAGSDIVCLYDCIHETFPWDFVGIRARAKRVSYILRARRNVQKAKKVITVSETSKTEIARFYGLDTDLIEVVPSAWHHMERIECDSAILSRLGLEGKNFLFSLGGDLPHKNRKWVLEAARQNPDYFFVISGSNRFAREDEGLPRLENVICAGYLTDAEIKALMSSCAYFLFPSLCEGFGIPPLEALSCGAKIIVSDYSCLPEVYGDCAIYIDPLDYVDIDLSEVTKGADSVAPPERVLERYSWKQSAKQLANIIHTQLAGK